MKVAQSIILDVSQILVIIGTTKGMTPSGARLLVVSITIISGSDGLYNCCAEMKILMEISLQIAYWTRIRNQFLFFVLKKICLIDFFFYASLVLLISIYYIPINRNSNSSTSIF